MNFGTYIIQKLNELKTTRAKFVSKTGIGNSGVNRWRRGQQPRVDTFVISCEVIARLSGEPFECVILDGLKSLPSYRSAVERFEQVSGK